MKVQLPTQYSHSVIYGLIDPRNQQVKYIGCSKNVSRRYIQHVRVPSRCLRKWVSELQDLQLNPVLTIFEATANKLKWLRETEYIQEHRQTILNKNIKYRRRFKPSSLI